MKDDIHAALGGLLRRRYIRVVGLLGALTGWLLAGAALSGGPYSTPTQWIFSAIVGGNRTRYSDGYSEWAWMKIKVGMPESDVVRLLGRAKWVDSRSDDVDFWEYTRADAPRDSYHIRTLKMRDHTVVQKVSKYSRWPY